MTTTPDNHGRYFGRYPDHARGDTMLIESLEETQVEIHAGYTVIRSAGDVEFIFYPELDPGDLELEDPQGFDPYNSQEVDRDW